MKVMLKSPIKRLQSRLLALKTGVLGQLGMSWERAQTFSTQLRVAMLPQEPRIGMAFRPFFHPKRLNSTLVES